MAKHHPLPVDAILPQLLTSLEHTPNLVLEAPPGAGKTTRVPPALLPLVTGEILILEPRRLAARMAARRVAQERNEPLGETVGYTVRFEDVSSPRTRLRFVTEGILTRRLLSDPTLRGVGAVILDEFHERHLDADLALALLKRLQATTRPELRLVVMSATLDAGPIAAFLGNCPTLRSEGRMFPLAIEHLPYTPDPLPVQVLRAARILHTEGHTGNTLAFLPGLAEIRRAERELQPFARTADISILPLHGDLTPEEQDRAVLPSPGRKLILATNVAESSVTVAGVTAVIDSGFSRQASVSPWTGLPTLKVARISKASATQRAGRAGRTAPGRVLRLYPEADLALRPDHDLPEIARADLAQLLLALRAMGIEHPDDLDWLTAPPPEAVVAAESLLDRLGARAAQDLSSRPERSEVERPAAPATTEPPTANLSSRPERSEVERPASPTATLARRMAALPLPPRFARTVLAAQELHAVGDACRAAALLSLNLRSDANDLLRALDNLRSSPDPRWQQQTSQLLRATRASRQSKPNDEGLLQALLLGFPDRVARRRSPSELTLCNGTAAELAGAPLTAEFLLVLDAEDREDQPQPLVRMTSAIEPEWLLEFFPDRVTEHTEAVWHRTGERVEQLKQLRYDNLILEETRGPASEEAAADLLATKAEEAGLDRLFDLDIREALTALQARLAFAGLPAPDIHAHLHQLALGLRSFAELRAAAKNFLPLLESTLDTRRLNELAPATLRLGNGRQTRVHYEHDRAPWIASRLQDFFGMSDTPRLGPARTPVVVHLLAPNQRAVQTTTDLAGFWERLYPTVRRELMRRYPRHSWPERPVAPLPPNTR